MARGKAALRAEPQQAEAAAPVLGLSATELRHFHEKGWIHKRGVIDARTIAAIAVGGLGRTITWYYHSPSHPLYTRLIKRSVTSFADIRNDNATEP